MKLSDLVNGAYEWASATFSYADWKKFGYDMNCIFDIENHPRLLRSLSWGDPDYGDCVYSIFEILVKDSDLANRIKNHSELKKWLKVDHKKIEEL
ncbi:MAG: hypothetical protein R1F52_07465 [Candidatus Nitrosoabyssus spongiisocia]|nr:MAG: hypothetical protein R1F52_07465 [Nitrosopumilaceae archaeon AB1(1)]